MSQRILFICAHPDDEVIGAGGTILHHTVNGDNVNVIFLSDGESSRGFNNTYNNIKDRRESSRKACSILGVNSTTFYDFSDNSMDNYSLLEIVKVIEKEIDSYKPSVVYTHHSGDLNIDHQITNKAVLTACRPTPECIIEKIFTFEVLSSTNWSSVQYSNVFTPNYYVDISPYILKKVDALKAYTNEICPYPHSRSFDAIQSLSIYRGTTVGVKYAEAFFIERFVERNK